MSEASTTTAPTAEEEAPVRLTRSWFRRWLPVFQDRFPTIHPVVVERPARLDAGAADCCVRTRKGGLVIVIRLPANLPPIADYELFVHEYAHAMQWRVAHQDPELHHDPEFGLAYARLCAWLDGEAV